MFIEMFNEMFIEMFNEMFNEIFNEIFIEMLIEMFNEMLIEMLTSTSLRQSRPKTWICKTLFMINRGLCTWEICRRYAGDMQDICRTYAGHMQLFPSIQSVFFLYSKTYICLDTYISEKNALFHWKIQWLDGGGGSSHPPNWIFHLKGLILRGGGAVSTP